MGKGAMAMVIGAVSALHGMRGKMSAAQHYPKASRSINAWSVRYLRRPFAEIAARPIEDIWNFTRS